VATSYALNEMVNPTLKKLSNSKLSDDELADLLEKHIGQETNLYACQVAFEALTRTKKIEIKKFAFILNRFSDGDIDYCDLIRSVIAHLRSKSFLKIYFYLRGTINQM